MRVALVSEHADPLAAVGGVDAGGQNVHVAALATHLARRGHEVVVYTRRDHLAKASPVEMGPGVVVDYVEAGPPSPVAKDDLYPYMGAFSSELLARWRRWRPHVAHAHFWMSGVATLQAARAIGVPVVQTFHALGVVKRRHQGAADTSPPMRCAVEAALAAGVERIVASCADEAGELAALGADASKVRVVPCGVDLERFCTTGAVAERSCGGPNRGLPRARILSVGRLVPRKGVAEVIEALAELAGRDPADTELLVAGGPGPEAENLRQLAGRLGVAERVVMLGQIDHHRLPALLRSADVVVCTPWYEPFGMVPLEAMACGVPVVASAVGGLLDTVVDGVTGLHVPPRQPDALAGALRRLLREPSWAARLGAAGAERAASRYGWPAVAAEHEQVYLEVVARRPASPPARPTTPQAMGAI